MDYCILYRLVRNGTTLGYRLESEEGYYADFSVPDLTKGNLPPNFHREQANDVRGDIEMIFCSDGILRSQMEIDALNDGRLYKFTDKSGVEVYKVSTEDENKFRINASNTFTSFRMAHLGMGVMDKFKLVKFENKFRSIYNKRMFEFEVEITGINPYVPEATLWLDLCDYINKWIQENGNWGTWNAVKVEKISKDTYPNKIITIRVYEALR